MRPCALCGSSSCRVLYAGTQTREICPRDLMITRPDLQKPEISRCLSCGIVYNSSAAFERAVYCEVVDEKYDDGAAGRMLEFSWAYKAFKKYFPPCPPSKIKLLDAGCFTGVFLDYLKREEEGRVEAWGIEPSRWAASRARLKGLSVQEGFLEELLKAGLALDAVTLFDVIEHVEDPGKLLENLRDSLGPEGLLLLTTPNFQTLFRALLKSRYWFIERMHLFYFSPATIRRLLEKSGFEVLSVRRHLKMMEISYLTARIAAQFPRLSFLARIPWPVSFRLPVYAGQMRVIARKRTQRGAVSA